MPKAKRKPVRQYGLRIERADKLNRYIVNQDNELVADMYADSVHDFGIPDNVEINRYAALFASAPALLKVLRDVELLMSVNATMNAGSPMHKTVLLAIAAAERVK